MSTRLKDLFKKRVEKIVKEIKGFPNLFGVVIANEPIPPRRDPHDEDFVNWFNGATLFVQEKLDRISILPGVANPYFISEEIQGLSANTAHVYPNDPISFLHAIRYSKSGRSPLFVHELGVPERFFGVDVSFPGEILSFFTRSLIMKASNSNLETREVELGISSLTFWKKDSYFDGFNFDSKNYPKTYKIVRSLGLISRAIAI